MARRRKEGRRATGIQAKNGMLYTTTSKPVIVDGKTTYKRGWISTGLKDTPENVTLATAERCKILHQSKTESLDINITLSDYIERFLKRKKEKSLIQPIPPTTIEPVKYRPILRALD